MKKNVISTIIALSLSSVIGVAYADNAPSSSVTKSQQSAELTRQALKMSADQMMSHKKVGSISGSAQTQADLERKFAMSAAMMGAKYYVITGLSVNNHAFGNADLYE